MTIIDRKNDHPGSPGKEKETPEEHARAGHDENCRCKETSKMSAQELLRLMMSDLAFWKKTKQG
jgi:hypothetical protein